LAGRTNNCTGTDVRSGEFVAIKLQHARDGAPELSQEVEIYEALSGGIGIPRIRWFGEECEFIVMIQDLLGPSLLDLLTYCEGRFSLKTVLLLAEQVISRVRYIHSKSYLHCDIKPENFLMGVEKLGNMVYAIDFGMAASFYEEHRELAGFPFGGTARYASLRSHIGLCE
jgi:serine/threonine protein kinase